MITKPIDWSKVTINIKMHPASEYYDMSWVAYAYSTAEAHKGCLAFGSGPTPGEAVDMMETSGLWDGFVLPAGRPRCGLCYSFFQHCPHEAESTVHSNSCRCEVC